VVTEESRQRCIDNASVARSQPQLTLEELMRGPGDENVVPRDKPVHCRFIPYDMQLKHRGKSKKFWCHRLDEGGRFYNDRFQPEPKAVGVTDRGFLAGAGGQVLRHEDGSPQKADVLKVKYTTGGNRGREVHTEVAASRLLWTLGFPADHMFPVSVQCAGCSEDPFRDVRTDKDNRPVNETHSFPNATIERRVIETIETEPDQGWDWGEVYESAGWTSRTRTEFEAYVLALNMFHFHNGVSKQNSVGCEKGYWDPATGICSRPVILLDDLGATFGGGRSRGDLSKYASNTVFVTPGSCELRADLAGFRLVPEAARRLLADRLSVIDEAVVRTIFEVAGLDHRNTDASLDEWVAVFMERIAEVKGARCQT
jgi:hypothetical protein